MRAVGVCIKPTPPKSLCPVPSWPANPSASTGDAARSKAHGANSQGERSQVPLLLNRLLLTPYTLHIALNSPGQRCALVRSAEPFSYKTSSCFQPRRLDSITLWELGFTRRMAPLPYYALISR